MTTTKPTTCIHAARAGCGDREAHPYMTGGGPVCDLHMPDAATASLPDARPRARIAQVLGASVVDWAPNQTGPCARCTAPCRRYGPGGNPLCATCRAALSNAA